MLALSCHRSDISMSHHIIIEALRASAARRIRIGPPRSPGSFLITKSFGLVKMKSARIQNFSYCQSGRTTVITAQGFIFSSRPSSKTSIAKTSTAKDNNNCPKKFFKPIIPAQMFSLCL
jgi:hypothetical protein